MGFERPSTTEVQKKDLRRVYGLSERLSNYVDDPYLDELQELVRKMLRMDDKRHEPMD
jgi:hypothetical protein